MDGASRKEYDLFDDHYDLVGDVPQTAIGDEGFSVESAFRKCTSNGTAPSSPGAPGMVI
jgi:hypothetical protein